MAKTNIAQSALGQTRFVDFKHFIDPGKKDAKWVLEAIQNIYQSGGCKSMLNGKKTDDIIKYAEGRQSTDKIRNMFKGLSETKKGAGGSEIEAVAENLTGLDFEPLGILQDPLNQGIASLTKRPIYINCTAMDATALMQKARDKEYLAYRKTLQQENEQTAQKLGIPSIQTPEAPFNASGVDIEQLDLDPSKPDELDIYMNFFHTLGPETAMEAALRALEYINELKNVRDLNIKDEFLWACHASQTYFSDVTGLPVTEYLHPGNVYLPVSLLPDYTDVPYLFTEKPHSIEDMMNKFGKDGIGETEMENIFDSYWKGRGSHYKWNDAPAVIKAEGLPVVYFEWKTFDVIKVHSRVSNKAGRRFREIVEYDYQLADRQGNPKPNSPDDYVETKYPQQTYYAYWVPFTDRVLRYGKVLGSFREKGKESLSPFTIKVFRSQAKSTVELCMPVVDDYQRTYTKMQQHIIASKPSGAQLDLKFVRQAAANLKDTGNWSVKHIITLFAQRNILIIDSTGLDDGSDGNFPAYKKIEGGLGSEVQGFLMAMMNSLNQITTLTGRRTSGNTQNTNPEGLVGIEKLLLQQTSDSIHYALVAINRTNISTYRTWADYIQFICRPKNKGTASYKALEGIIGAQKVSAIQYMGSLSAHQIGIEIEDAPTEEQQAELRQMLAELVRGERIDLADYYMVKRIMSWKDAEALLIIREKKRAQKKQAQAMAIEQIAANKEKVKEDNKFSIAKYMADGEVREEQVKAQAAAAAQDKDAKLQITLLQIDAQLKELLKDKQGQQGIEKITQKADVDAQTSLV